MKGLRGIHHVAIIVSDYAESRHFYQTCLGLELVSETFQPARDSWKLNLALPDGSQLEIFHFQHAPQRLSYPEARGLRHLALAVEDLSAAIADLARHGIECQPTRIDPLTQQAFCFLTDPDGLPIELYECKSPK